MNTIEVTYEYPDPSAMSRLASLVGIDDKKERLEKGLKLALNPNSLSSWSQRHHNKVIKSIESIANRPPLFILAGDVGVGKTALAESVGDAVARSENIGIYLYRMSLASRGSGLVGEMTKLVSAAFSEVAESSRKLKLQGGRVSGGCILFIDEADALVQTREDSQMHHEDRAGVNAVIRGIDDISANGLPMAVIMCTNRLSALDPAIQRRAADIIIFTRPNDEQRKRIFTNAFFDIGFSDYEIEQLVTATGPKEQGDCFTFSDLTQRFIPRVVLDAYPHGPVTFSNAMRVLDTIKATPSFKDGN